MISNLRNTLKFVLLSLKCNFKAAFEYKKSFIIQSVFMIINNFFFLIYWVVVFSLNDGNLNGIVFKDILIIWAIPNGAWGLANFLFGGLRDIDKLIISGGLDTYLLQPKNLIISIALSKSRFHSFGDLAYGVVLAMLVAETIGELLLLYLFMITGAILMMACYIIVRSFAIWFGDMENIASTYENSLLITLSTYPMDIFGNVIKVVMFTVVPTAYISHIPNMIFKGYDIKLSLIVFVASILYFGVAAKFFYWILKRYESGNNIAMKD